MKTRRKAKLLIAGGGTGGHVTAGLAVADEWRALHAGSASEVVFVGAQGGVEERLVPKAGYRLVLLSLGALKGTGVARKLKTLLQLPLAFLKAFLLLLRYRPSAVLGVGGYASGPTVLTARLLGWLWGVRVAILEQNAIPGFTNRVLGKFSHLIFSAFPGLERRFPGGNVVVTGNPVRKAFQAVPSPPREPFTVFVFGGSQGAMGINTLVIDALPLLAKSIPSLRFIHQTGPNDLERVKAGHRAAGTEARVEAFIFDMQAAYSAASVVVCRAGSSTLSEISAAGRAAILIPYPYASDGHQEENARVFVAAGAAKTLPQLSSSGADLAQALLELHSNPQRMAEMEEAAKILYRGNAARSISEALSAALP